MRKVKGHIVPTTNTKHAQLTEKEKKFCEIYCQYGVSGIDAVLQAGYDVNSKNTAYSIASENLRKPKIIAYIEELYKEFRFTDEDVMREHLYLIKQHHDMSCKARAIDMYYKKKGLYSPEVQENTTVVVTKYADMSDEELEKQLEERIERIRPALAK